MILEVFPMLCVRGAADAIEFYRTVFGAEELMRLDEPSGRVAHAELRLGPMVLMLADEFPDHHFLSPATIGGTATMLHLHVRDVDALAERAVKAGARLLLPPTDQGHGERQCTLRDPFGHQWLLGQEIVAMSPEEIKRRFNAGAES